MTIAARKMKSAWKHRRMLWKYRNLIRHRCEIAGGMVAAGALLAACFLANRAHRA